MESDKKHTPIGEKGEGLYSDATVGCYDVCDRALPMALSAAGRMANHVGCQNVVTVVDYGCADGGTDLLLWIAVVSMLKEFTKQVVHIWNDQSSNDWNSLFNRVDGTIGSKDYKLLNTFSMASGTSFYNQVAPDESVHFGFSSTAMHWLYQLPDAQVPCIHANVCHSEEFRNQAAQDWLRILEMRERELVRGGRMVIVLLGVDEEGSFLGDTRAKEGRPQRSMFQTLNNIWKQMFILEKITEDEYLQTTFCNYYRTASEVKQAFHHTSLQLEEFETSMVECPLYNKFKNGQLPANDFAAALVMTVKTWSFSTFYGGLDKSRTHDSRTLLVEELYSRYQKKIQDEPHLHGMDYIHHYMTIVKSDQAD